MSGMIGYAAKTALMAGLAALAALAGAKGVTATQTPAGAATVRTAVHPDSSTWPSLFKANLSNADNPQGVWTMTDGVLTACKDEAIWTTRLYENFVLDLEFKTVKGTNSGVIVYCNDIKNWIPNSVEIQIAGADTEQQVKLPTFWDCGAIFGHLPPSENAVKKPGEWNRFTIRCMGQKIDVALNGKRVTSVDMSRWTSAKVNPDGTEIPAWLSTPLAQVPTRGKIGLQGRHGGAPIWFRNIKIKEFEAKQ